MEETRITMQSDPVINPVMEEDQITMQSDPAVKTTVDINRSKPKFVWIFYILSTGGLCFLMGFFIYKALQDYYFV
jgi:hypothetical protein